MKPNPEDELEQASLDRLTSYTQDQPLLFGMVMSLFMLFEPKKGEEKTFNRMKNKFVKNVDKSIQHQRHILQKGEKAKEDNAQIPGAAR